MSEWSVSLHPDIHAIPAAEWDACAGDDNPFVSHAYLSALEDSGSASARTGWMPRHLKLIDPMGQTAAVVPLYLKSHSWGEYVFDQSWARAFEQAGGRYYPKMQAAVPFAPVPGPRLLLRPDDTTPPEVIVAALGDAMRQVCGELDLSSAHVTFCSAQERALLAEHGWLARTGMQFHWHNRDYRTFDDFLDTLASRKRKVLRRERRDANGCGLVFRTVRGGDITPELWDAFHGFYLSTIDRKWGSAYLTPEFFTMLSERLGDRVVLMIAEHDGVPVAGALNLVGRDTLYGRNWGCVGEWPFLHFELCYYRAIDFAIEHGLARVEAGAQGEHKIQRGYVPAETCSAHWIDHPDFRRAIANFVEEEAAVLREEMQELAALSPYRRDEA